MFPLRHQSKCGVDSNCWKGAKWQRSKRPTFDQGADLLQHPASQGFVTRKHRVHGHDVERGVASQRPKRYSRIQVNIPFPDLDKTPELSQTGKSHRDGFASERV